MNIENYNPKYIEIDNQKHIEKFKYSPPNPSYIVGFIDGDGCIFIRKIKHGYQSGINISQSRTNILQVLRYHFGGNITSSEKRNNYLNSLEYDKTTKRNQYNLNIRSNEYDILLNYIKNNIVIKTTQMDCLNKFTNYVKLKNNNEKEELYKLCSYYNKTHKSDNIILDNINIQYIAGIFDAEGCIYISKSKYSKYYISITQKNNPSILYKIQELLKLGTIDSEKKYKIYNKVDCLKFLRLIKPYLIVKLNQLCAFETLLTTDNNIIKDEMYKICNREKHEIEYFTDLNKTNRGKEGFNKRLVLNELINKYI